MSNESLQTKLMRFEEGLTELERLRLTQLRGSLFKGSLLTGGAGVETRTVAGVARDIPHSTKAAVNLSLSEKLVSFQAGLNDSERVELLASIASSSAKQSSFGVEE